ncbi:MAG: U32 family peptidase [Treponema sp.]|nr:U32 family peptidase [Treponema sp.]
MKPDSTRVPELLAPAGSPEALDAAIAGGADAVYLGLKSFNARMRSANFAYSQFEGALRVLHRQGRRVYVTVNTVFEQREADRVYQLLKYLAALGPDGVILQDFGAVVMAGEFPGLKLHASTQMNIASARGANALSSYGVSRVVLARELTLEEIQGVVQGTNVELEVFVHGALCASASGLCLFSSYLGGKSANRGLCTQACRRFYRTGEVPGPAFGDPPGAGLEEKSRGGYFFSPRDLSLIGRVPELAAAGVRSFKIEGRMKSAEYVGAVVAAYRLVLDSLGGGEEQGRRAQEQARRVLQNDFARPKTEYFFGLTPGGGREAGAEETIDWLMPDHDGGTGIRLGTIVSVKGEGEARRVLVRSEFPVQDAAGERIDPVPGDSLRFHKADDSRRLAYKLRFAERAAGLPDGGEGGNAAAGKGSWLISAPPGFDRGDSVYLIQTRAMTRRCPPVIPRDLSSCTRRPGRDRAPAFPPGVPSGGVHGTGNRRQGRFLPEGVYAAAASPEDLYVIQSLRPAAVILPLNKKTGRRLLDRQRPLPFKPGELIVALDPYFPQGAEAFYAETIPALIEAGYETFMPNNPGQFSFFKGGNAARKKGGNPAGERGSGPGGRLTLIAGPWLYTFNARAAAFVQSLGADYAVSPLENNRQNLEKTWGEFPPLQRSRVFVTLFAWPPLFRIRQDLGKTYAFRRFSGGRGEEFYMAAGGTGELMGETVVIPDRPFSIADKRPFLEAAGFRRFILDFSAGIFGGASFPLKKHVYKDIMKAVLEGVPLPGTSRFNWKDGFYQSEAGYTPAEV